MKYSPPKTPKWILDRLREWNKLKNALPTSSKRLQEEGRMNIPVRAFDTETLDGYVKLLACSDGNFIYFDTITDNNIDSILQFMTMEKYRRTLNFFYNIDFDIAAIIKYLPEKELKQLISLNRVEYKDYQINYVPKKAFTIRRNKKVWRYFDLWQYYRLGLDKAVKQYINASEGKDPIDRKKLGEDAKYWLKHKDAIIKYCIKDAYLTQKLGELMQKKLNDIGISFDMPYSTGTISVRYFSQYYEFPRFTPTDWNKYAYLSYFGGRFEVTRKGVIDYVIVQDINSAYPYQISNLLDIDKGVWQKSSKIDEDADIGFYKIVIEKSPDHPIQPFSFRDNGLVYYPQFNNIIHYCTLDELLFALDNYDDLEIRVLDGWNFYAREEVYPFENIKEIYEHRKRIKKEDPVMQLVLKIIMNSLYGKAAEKTEGVYEVDPDEADDFLYFGEYVPVSSQLKPGKVFNPVYASLITARTRVMLLEEAIKYPDYVVAMFTDSLISTKPLIRPTSQLGGWDNEGEGEALIIGCGVYTVRDENKGYLKTRLRGMHVDFDNIDLFKVAEENKDKTKIEIEWTKSIRPKEAALFKNKYDLKDINHFISYQKQLHVRMDRKRIWHNDPLTFGQLLNDTYESDPIFVTF